MRSIILTKALGIAMLMGTLLPACGEKIDGADNGGNNQGDQRGRGLLADCNEGDPNVGPCMVGLECQFGVCLEPGAGCAVSTDCVNAQDMCNPQNHQCQPSGCEDQNGALGWCDQLTNDQDLNQCVSLNEQPAGTLGCCDENADCALGVCNMDTHECAGCLGDVDCAADMRCDMVNMVCRPEPCDQQPDWCLQPVRDEVTHACSQVQIPNCCNAGDDAACQMPCNDDADCAEGMHCPIRPDGHFYCVPNGSEQIRGCQVNAVEGQPNQCAWGDDPDNDGSCQPNEVCGDGADNNCNALTDENCPQQCAPAMEVCNGIDDDCDGNVDNVFGLNDPITMGCGTDEGECVMGVSTCMNAQWGACNGEVTPVAEACDGMDNDCDGMTDEDAMNANPLTMACYSGPEGTEGVGLCQGGWSSCMMAQWGPCMGEVVPADDTCDGADNNCNGATDEGFGLGQVCSLGLGDCMAMGVTVCDGPNATMCNAVPGQPGVEVCDAGHLHDEDCDGQTDPLALCDSDNDTVRMPEDNCPNWPNPGQENGNDSRADRGDACFADIVIDANTDPDNVRVHLFYSGAPANIGDTDGGPIGRGHYSLTEEEACTFDHVEFSLERGESGEYLGCNQNQPAFAADTWINGVLTPFAMIVHPWVCGGQGLGNGYFTDDQLGCFPQPN